MTQKTLRKSGSALNRWSCKLIFFLLQNVIYALLHLVLQSISLPHIMCCCIVLFLPASQWGKMLVGEDTRSLRLSYNTPKTTIRQIHDFGMCNCFSCITMNLRPWPFETLRSITVAVEGTHSSDILKHGFRFHRMFTTGQKKTLHFQWDLHRLVRSKADLTCYCRWFDSRPGWIEFPVHKSWLEIMWFWIETVGSSSTSVRGYETSRLFNTYRPFERTIFSEISLTDEQSVLILDSWIFFDVTVRTQNLPLAVYSVEHNHEE